MNTEGNINIKYIDNLLNTSDPRDKLKKFENLDPTYLLPFNYENS
jgi:hypothetical protein